MKHIVKYVPIGGFSDSFECSCGWKSNGYWDMESAAWGEWLLHAYDTGTPVEAKDQKFQSELLRHRTERRESLERQRASIDRQLERLKGS